MVPLFFFFFFANMYPDNEVDLLFIDDLLVKTDYHAEQNFQTITI